MKQWGQAIELTRQRSIRLSALIPSQPSSVPLDQYWVGKAPMVFMMETSIGVPYFLYIETID
jgi:hypothetical protein